MLMSNGADATIQLSDGHTALHLAARRKYVEICRVLLKDPRVNVNVADSSGATPLHVTCVEGDVQICELLINRKANITAADSDGKTPFHYAAFHGHQLIVELLFASGRGFVRPSCLAFVLLHELRCDGFIRL